jgi:hypothetical protein
LIFFVSADETIKPYLFLPLAFLVLSESKCLFQALSSLNLPLPVTLTLFLTQLLVFKVIIVYFTVINNYLIGFNIATNVLPFFLICHSSL